MIQVGDGVCGTRTVECRWKEADDSQRVLEAELFLAVGSGEEDGRKGHAQFSSMSH